MEFTTLLNLEVVTPETVYNLQLFECYLIVDLRASDKYQEGHIASAINFPPPKNIEDNENSLLRFARWADDNHINELWSPVILYGDDRSAIVEDHLISFAKAIQDYINFKNHINDELIVQNNIITKIANNCKALWRIKGGYLEFANRYEFLCGSWNTGYDGFGANSLVPLPIDVTSSQSYCSYNVLLGSRAINWTSEMLKKFGVSRIIFDKESAQEYADILVDSGILTMVCDVPDESRGQRIESVLFPLWNKTSTFISEGLGINLLNTCNESTSSLIKTSYCNNINNISRPNRVLIHLHGRSRSASIAVAWLMKHFSLSHDRAIADVTFSAPGLLDLSLMYSSFLIDWQSSAYDGILLDNK